MNTVSMPFDVRLMNFTASVLFSAVVLGTLATGLWWALRHPAFALAGITVQGDLNHTSEVSLRTQVAPKLVGNFFTVDLRQARAAFETVPWVRKALVQREFPNRLKVVLEEHKGVAFWGQERDSRLVNSYGEVFEANIGELESDDLPYLSGPEGQAAQVLTMVRSLAPALEPLGATLDELELSARGGWRARLDSGATIELGSGTVAEVRERTLRFVRTLPQVTGKQGRTSRDLLTADLRYGDAYAVRLRGVTTGDAAKKK
ncbi:MAG: cell division protein FtsQ/DivIB [Pseudomonadota bacterium]